MTTAPSPKFLLHARIKEFTIPPITDGMVIGKEAAIGAAALRKALNLLIPDHFEHIQIADEIISDVLVKSAIIRRLTQARLQRFIVEQVKPFMTDRDILHIELQAEISLTGEME